ncbi:MAG: YkvA family protein [Cyanobacteriota bacterium]|nr:YkvA family protein [Cyanobacteriota bacterium]
MGIKDRYFGNSRKESDEIEGYKTIDVQPSPPDETPSEAKEGFIKQIWNKFRKDSHSDEAVEIEPKIEIAQDTKSINQEPEAADIKEVKQKNRLQSIIQNIFNKDAIKKDADVSAESTKNTIEQVEPQIVSEPTVKTNSKTSSNKSSNKIKKIISQLTQKEKEQIKTEEAIEEVEERLEKATNSGKIKNIFEKLVKSVNPQDIQNSIQKITEKLPAMNRGPIKEIWPKIQSLFQMVLDPKAAWTSKALAVGALLYLISPFDAIPDVIPIAGLTDDAAVIVSVVSTLAFELSKYAKQSASKGIEVAEELADIEVRKYNRIVRITLTGSILAAILAIAVKIILKHI